MQKYIVEVKEVYISSMEIEAENEGQALELVGGGEGVEVKLEYHCPLDDYLDQEPCVYSASEGLR